MLLVIRNQAVCRTLNCYETVTSMKNKMLLSSVNLSSPIGCIPHVRCGAVVQGRVGLCLCTAHCLRNTLCCHQLYVIENRSNYTSILMHELTLFKPVFFAGNVFMKGRHTAQNSEGLPSSFHPARQVHAE